MRRYNTKTVLEPRTNHTLPLYSMTQRITAGLDGKIKGIKNRRKFQPHYNII